MNEKKTLQLSIFVVCFLMFLLSGWYFFSKQKQAVEIIVDRNYDYIMKNDPIGQTPMRRRIIIRLYYLGRRHFVRSSVIVMVMTYLIHCNINVV